MEPISATVITFNEEDNIEGSLRSLHWADEIVVVDSGSTDGTLEICRKYTGRVIQRAWTGYVDQKNHAVDQSHNNWILSLDADERLSPELVEEILALRSAGFRQAGYRIPRVAWFMNRWIRHGDWYPDHQLRLFDRRLGRWQGGRVHESVKVRGAIGFTKGEIHHYTYRRLSDYIHRLETYSSLAAQDYRERGRAATPLRLVTHPAVTFLKTYLIKRGFLDGTPGLMVAVMGAISVYFKYAKLWELQGAEAGRSRTPDGTGKHAKPRGTTASPRAPSGSQHPPE
jgi:glycosyltransferase involved in cell wall biosynthesis